MKFTFDGELVQQSTKCKNKRDAETVEGAYRTQLALGKIGIKPKPKAPTMEQAIDDFLAKIKVERGEASPTVVRYEFSCQPLKKYFGKMKADKVETKDIEKFIAWRSGQKSKKTGEFIKRDTVNADLLVLKMIFSRLIDARVLRHSPARPIKRLPANEREFYVLSEAEEKKYLMACPQPLRDVAALMLETGMRCGEVYRIRRQDVFLTQGFLKVVKGKTASSIRRVYLSERAKGILETRLNRFAGENLFPQNETDGEKPTASLVKLHLAAVANLGYKFRLYDCRHTFATRAVKGGMDLVVLASILGHASLKMVMRYSHPSENFKAEAIKQMEKAKAV
ncbi:MAG TPA: site-specific integrase [Pyrinomonadaceae bacterium]|jgi:integrase